MRKKGPHSLPSYKRNEENRMENPKIMIEGEMGRGMKKKMN
jgi:hypothetical protein